MMATFSSPGVSFPGGLGDVIATVLITVADRAFLHLFETALREECGYTDPSPYWDWTRGIILNPTPLAFY